ncbi:unnamed protein product, partial [Prorocentrum cordatum]
MINTIFNRNSPEFEAAKQDGEVWSDPDEPGKYAYDTAVRKTSKVTSNKRVAKETFNPKDAKMFRGGMADFMLEEPPTWKPMRTENKSARKALHDTRADQNDYTLLQNCNDAMTTVTLALKRMGPEVMSYAKADVSRKLAKDTMELLKKVTKLQAEEPLIAAGKCYEDLMAMHSQCANLIKTEKRKSNQGGGGSSGSKLAKMSKGK